MSLGENRLRPNPHNPRFSAQSGLRINHWALGVPQERKQLDIADRPLLLVYKHEEEEMAYIETKPCQLPGVLGDWHPPLPTTKDGNGNVSSTWLYSCISNAPWVIAARAPRRTAQLNSAASGWAEDDAHRKVELGEDGAFSLSSLALASVSLLVQLQICLGKNDSL